MVTTMMTVLLLLLPFLSASPARVAVVLPPAAPAELWACDGCSFTGTEAQVNAHVVAGMYGPAGLREPEDVTCWGSLLVGGPAWEAHVFHGVHPMSILAADVRALGGAA